MSKECIFKCKEGFRALIELEKKELVYDIKNTAFIFAHSLPGDISDQVKHNVYEIGEDGNRDKLARMLDEAVEDCREMLFTLTRRHAAGHEPMYESDAWEECVGAPGNDMDSYYINMVFPFLASRTALHTLGVYVHNYIVNTVLYNWMLLAYPSGTESFSVKTAELQEKIRKAVIRPSGRVRLVPHFFS